MSSQIASVPPPPISKLSRELLWYIFCINGHADSCYIDKIIGVDDIEHPTEEMAALTVTRRSSQVCKGWRDVLLNSPSIWATSLDLQRLDQTNDNWRKEVLMRTGNCPLTVIGDLYEDRPCTDFLSYLLTTHWSRMRRLFIYDRGSGLESEMAVALKQPSPELELLRLDMDLDDTGLNKGTLFFADFAPRLHGIEVQGIFLNPAMSWFQNLRQLWDLDISNFTFPEFFLAVRYMPHLQELKMRGNEYSREGGGSVSWEPVSVPSLNDLHLSGELSFFTAILKHLIPAPNCSLKLNVISKSIPNTDISELNDFQIALSTFTSHLKFPPRWSRVVYSLSTTMFYLANLDSNWKTGASIYVNKLYFNPAWGYLPCLILSALLPNVCTTGLVSLFLYLEQLPPFTDTLLNFFDSLSSLEHLSLNMKTLRILNGLIDSRESKRPILFPSMTTIYYYISDDDLEPEGGAALHHFLARRQNLNISVKRLVFFHWEKYSEVLQFLTRLSDNFNVKGQGTTA